MSKTVIFGEPKSKAGYTKCILFKGEYYTPRGVGEQKDIKTLPFFNFVMSSANVNRNLYNIEVLTEHDCGYHTAYYLYEKVRTNDIDWIIQDCKYYY